MQVQKIANLKPDLLLVGKSVSRQAQELLQQHKIVLVMNVKQSLMERIARRKNCDSCINGNENPFSQGLGQ